MQTAAAQAKPAYLGLLNAISLGESNAGVLLRAWADATSDEDLACCLRFVAARETSHGELFHRRLCELGFDLRKKSDPEALRRLAKFGDPKVSDIEKVGPEREESDEGLTELEQRITRGEFDPMTANMLSWFIAEEHDSAQRLREAYAGVRGMTNGAARKSNGHAADPAAVPSADAQAMMACMTAGFARLEKSMEKLAKGVR
ncbi:MAG TPA: hypothetical protein VII63_05335 [Caulobacteraceae bacterium]